MTTMADVWPPYRLRLRAGDLELRVVSDEDVPGLVELALAGIHPPEMMPFSQPWTLTAPEKLPAEMIRHYSSVRATFGPPAFDLQLAIRAAGVLVRPRAR